MKKFILFFAVAFFAISAHAQLANPVKWSYAAKKISEKEYEIVMTASLDNKWHLYAQDAGEGPEPTTFTFSPNPLVKLDGKVKEVGKLEKAFDPNFNSTLKFYSNKVDFIQKIKMKTSAGTVIKGTVSYMVCDDKKCLPPRDVPFTVRIPAK